MNGTAYLVMDYEQGESLSGRLQRTKKLLEPDILRVFRPIMDGLKVIHAAGYLHRDIKPSNILLREKGSSVLLDFGAARSPEGAEDNTITVILTPRYAPIEQYHGNGKLGPWSDLYSLGACFYHCMTGVAPRVATERMAAIVDDGEDRTEAEVWAQKGYSDTLKEITCSLLKPRIKERPTAIDKVRTRLYGAGALRVPPGLTQGKSHRTIDSKIVTRAAQALTEYFGPIAKVMARKAAKRANSQDEFLQLLAAELPDQARS